MILQVLLLDFAGLATNLLELVLRLLPDRAVRVLLFGGSVRAEHKTTFALKEIAERYKRSIGTLNFARSSNVGFAAIAFYAFLVIPKDQVVEVPLVTLSITQSQWIQIAPAIAFGLQLFTLTAFLWFMVLRIGQFMLLREVGKTDNFGDITDVALEGPIGHMWLVLQLWDFIDSRWNLLWYVPAVVLILAVVLSPLGVPLIFILALFRLELYVVAFSYAVLFLPYAVLLLILVGAGVILALGGRALTESLAQSKAAKARRKDEDPDIIV
jgi:hypothetical protein